MEAPAPLDGVAGDQRRTWQVVEQCMEKCLGGDVVGKERGHAGAEARADVRTQELVETGLERVRLDRQELAVRRDPGPKDLHQFRKRVPLSICQQIARTCVDDAALPGPLRPTGIDAGGAAT